MDFPYGRWGFRVSIVLKGLVGRQYGGYQMSLAIKTSPL